MIFLRKCPQVQFHPMSDLSYSNVNAHAHTRLTQLPLSWRGTTTEEQDDSLQHQKAPNKLKTPRIITLSIAQHGCSCFFSCLYFAQSLLNVADKLLVKEDPGLYHFINQGCLDVDGMEDMEEMQIADVRLVTCLARGCHVSCT